MLVPLVKRIEGKYQRTASKLLWRRLVGMKNDVPIISFTFDDFPKSALDIGGEILQAHGVVGTYYVSLGLLDQDAPTGRICSAADIERVLAHGHELGCHTFGHCDAWKTNPQSFEESIVANRLALKSIAPHEEFLTMAYPISSPRPGTKRRVGDYFAGCRAGGQDFNWGTVDLNYIRAFFLEKSRNAEEVIWQIIARNQEQRGWLVFATHDISDRPTPYGCTPEMFEAVVVRAKSSGAMILPVKRALSLVSRQDN